MLTPRQLQVAAKNAQDPFFADDRDFIAAQVAATLQQVHAR